MKKLLSVCLSVTLALWTVSAAIAVPILSRGFYQAHVRALDLPGETGWTEEEILGAYDEMMAFELHGGEFGTGVLRWSDSGKAHFADVRVLFQLDLWVLGVTTVLLLILLLLSRSVRPHRFGGFGPSFWAGSGVLALFAVIGGLGAADFDRAFVVFHRIFFPGKSNWLFDPNVDEIIRILPEVYFRNCAILAIGLMIALCAAWMLLGRRRKTR